MFTPLRKVCFVEKGYDIDKHIEKMKDCYPTEFTIVELERKEIVWKKEGTNLFLDHDFILSKVKGYEEYDIASFFIGREWRNKSLYGVHYAKNFLGLEVNATRRSRSLYHGTAEHEDLHTVDNIIKEHSGIRLEDIFGVKDFDDDIVHRASSRRSYEFKDVWEKVSPYLSNALTVKRAKNKPEPTKWKYFTANEVKGLDTQLVDLLDKTREKAGIPFVINSGFRTVAHNTKVGGVPNSAHIDGTAVDIRSRNSEETMRIVQSALEVGFTRIGIAKTFVHLDISKKAYHPDNRIWLY